MLLVSDGVLDVVSGCSQLLCFWVVRWIIVRISVVALRAVVLEWWLE